MSEPDCEANTEKLAQLLDLKDERIAELEAEVERYRQKARHWENEIALPGESRRGEPEAYALAEAIIYQLNLPKNLEKGHWTYVPLHVFRKGFEAEKKEGIEGIDLYYVAEDKEKALVHLESELADMGAYLMMAHAEARRLRSEMEGGKC